MELEYSNNHFTLKQMKKNAAEIRQLLRHVVQLPNDNIIGVFHLK